ncbi:DUF7310 family coiled-coil domain-containing protein [Halomontanus rarus]|uniref:DUF7310 family coiled-coil domain-containing protein n=1 Tax=Halomontanus rarus TaxID=3034020 RepID=UPI001A981B0B
MSDIDRFEKRLAAVERAVVDGDFELSELADVASMVATVEKLEGRLDELEQRVAEVEGATQSVEGYVSRIESVNGDVEQRANTAIATVDRLERRLDDLERTVDGSSSTANGDQDRDRDRDRNRNPIARSSIDGRHAADDRSRNDGDPSTDADRTIGELMPDSSGDGSASSQRATDGGRGESSNSAGWSAVADQRAVEENLSSAGVDAEGEAGPGPDLGSDSDSDSASALDLETEDDGENGPGDAEADTGSVFATIRSKFT